MLAQSIFVFGTKMKRTTILTSRTMIELPTKKKKKYPTSYVIRTKTFMESMTITVTCALEEVL